jgi:predicted nucleotide-binding protein (sugar kinase/HSP70/actin superfamily)
VVSGSSIGDKIAFQGATARNKALVASFENKLNKPIYVSKFCHLTGALGSALILLKSALSKTKFRGVSLYKEDIPIESEVCNICNNNCKIKKVVVQNEIVAFGFLCGRDYDTKKYMGNIKSGFDIVREYRDAFKVENRSEKFISDTTVGIPSGLYLSEENALWTHFFNELGIKTTSSEGIKDAVDIGKRIAKAEFCTPITAFYGHAKYLSEKADYLFLPLYFDSRDREKDISRHYCYYTQFAASLVSSSKGIDIRERTIMPLIDKTTLLTKVELYKALNPFFGFNYWTISSAYDNTLEFYEECRSKMHNVFQREKSEGDDIDIVILGRPYVVLDNNMNKGIPGIFKHLDIKAFYHDMLTYTKDDVKEIESLLKAFHWNYTAKILSAALITAKTKGLYPVYMSSFKCSPDSFALEYFRRIMDAYEKPYIILDLDEHGSNVGYETRIEAAVRAFRNDFSQTKKTIDFDNDFLFKPPTEENISKKTLLLPSWDDSAVKLVEAVLIKEGVDARMVPLTDRAIQLGVKSNKGQCLPVNIIYQSMLDYVREAKLDPSNTMVWVLASNLACNIKLYPYLIKSMLESYGDGMENITIYTGNLTMYDISIKAPIEVYFAYMFAGMLRKMGCKLRPYEKEKGSVNKVIKQAESIFYNAFLGESPLEDAVVKVVNMFKDISVESIERPKIAIFGDLYVRDNDIMNQDLIKSIEDMGGELIVTSLSDIFKMIGDSYVKRWIRHRNFKEAIASKGIMMLTGKLEDVYYKHFNEILKEKKSDFTVDEKYIMKTFNVISEHSGESMDNLISIFALLDQHPNISLFVQVSPAFCCAGLITEAMNSKIESITGVPIVSIIYDGTEKNQNDKLIPYIKLRPQKNIYKK